MSSGAYLRIIHANNCIVLCDIHYDTLEEARKALADVQLGMGAIQGFVSQSSGDNGFSHMTGEHLRIKHSSGEETLVRVDLIGAALIYDIEVRVDRELAQGKVVRDIMKKYADGVQAGFHAVQD